jgi:RNA polymerase sigma-70 factor (ECF subfamily)
MKTDDNETIKSFLAGNQKAFEQLFKKYYPIILNQFKRLTEGNSDIAKDLTMELFEKIFENKKFNLSCNFGSWIYVVAENRFIDYYRKLENILIDGNPIEIRSKEQTPDEILISKEVVLQLNNALHKMEDSKMREILELHYFDGLSYKTISKQLHISIGVVGHNITQAKKILNKIIKV